MAYSGVDLPDTVIEPLSEKIDFNQVAAETEQLMARAKNKEDPVKQAQLAANQKVEYKLYFTDIEKSY